MTITRRAIKAMQASITLDNINLSNDYAGSGGGRIDLSGGGSSSYERIYREQPWVRIPVNKLARGIGRIPWAAYINGGKPGEREKQRSGPLAELLSRPAGRRTPSSLKGSIVFNLAVHANAILVKARQFPGMPPYALVPSSWARWTPIPGENEPIAWYVYTNGSGQRVKFRPEEIMHFSFWDGGDGTIGVSYLEALKRTLKVEDAAQRLQMSSYDHGGRPIGAYSVDKDVKLTKTQVDDTRAQLDDIYGGPDNAFKIAILTGGATWQSMQQNLVDADVNESRLHNREESVAVMDVPQPSVGILENAHFNNVMEQHLMLYQDTYSPYTTLIEETFQVQLIADEPLMQDQYVEFQFKEILKGDPKSEVEMLVRATGGPYMTANESRATQNLPPDDDERANHVQFAKNMDQGQSAPPAGVSDGTFQRDG